MTGPRHAKMFTCKKKTLHTETQRSADPTNQGNTGGACEEGYLPGRLRVGASTATCTSTSFANRLGLDKKQPRGNEPHWTRLIDASQTCYELVSCKCKAGCVRHFGALLCVSVKGIVHRNDLGCHEKII